MKDEEKEANDKNFDCYTINNSSILKIHVV